MKGSQTEDIGMADCNPRRTPIFFERGLPWRARSSRGEMPIESAWERSMPAAAAGHAAEDVCPRR